MGGGEGSFDTESHGSESAAHAHAVTADVAAAAAAAGLLATRTGDAGSREEGADEQEDEGGARGESRKSFNPKFSYTATAADAAARRVELGEGSEVGEVSGFKPGVMAGAAAGVAVLGAGVAMVAGTSTEEEEEEEEEKEKTVVIK